MVEGLEHYRDPAEHQRHPHQQLSVKPAATHPPQNIQHTRKPFTGSATKTMQELDYTGIDIVEEGERGGSELLYVVQ